MKVIIDPAAIIELNEAAAWYRTQGSRKIAKDLADEFKRVVALLAENPEAGPVWIGEARRFVMRRFPFNVVYRLYPDQLVIIAVAHQRRRPGYWDVRE